MKFKVGDRVYDIRYGIGKITTINNPSLSGYTVKADITNRPDSTYTAEGKYLNDDLNPTLLHVVEARAKGYDIPKIKTTHTVECWMTIHGYGYGEAESIIHCTEASANSSSRYNSFIRKVKLTGTYETEE